MSSFPDIKRRCEQLERTLRISWGVWVISMVLIALLLFSGLRQGTTQSEVLVTRQLVIVDKIGKPRIKMGVRPDGAAWIALYDTCGMRRLGIQLRPNGTPAVKLHDANGTPRAILSTISNGAPYFMFDHEDGTERINLMVKSDGRPWFYLLDARGRYLFNVP